MPETLALWPSDYFSWPEMLTDLSSTIFNDDLSTDRPSFAHQLLIDFIDVIVVID